MTGKTRRFAPRWDELSRFFSYCTTLCLQWEPEIIAIAVLYLACKLSKFEITDWTTKKENSKQKWWEQFVEGLTKEIIEGKLAFFLFSRRARVRSFRSVLTLRYLPSAFGSLFEKWSILEWKWSSCQYVGDLNANPNEFDSYVTDRISIHVSIIAKCKTSRWWRTRRAASLDSDCFSLERRMSRIIDHHVIIITIIYRT